MRYEVGENHDQNRDLYKYVFPKVIMQQVYENG